MGLGPKGGTFTHGPQYSFWLSLVSLKSRLDNGNGLSLSCRSRNLVIHSKIIHFKVIHLLIHVRSMSILCWSGLDREKFLQYTFLEKSKFTLSQFVDIWHYLWSLKEFVTSERNLFVVSRPTSIIKTLFISYGRLTRYCTYSEPLLELSWTLSNLFNYIRLTESGQ